MVTEFKKKEEEKPKIVGIKVEKVLPPGAIPVKAVEKAEKVTEAVVKKSTEKNAAEIAENFIKVLKPAVAGMKEFEKSELNYLLEFTKA
ncbi:MAG: hypothetical protein QW171_00950 [Candidatus Bilamarchaeaceae archaeon]